MELLDPEVLQSAQKEISPLVEQAQHIQITNDQEFLAAQDYLIANTKARKIVVGMLDPFREKAYQNWKDTVAEIKKWTDPLDEARSIVEPRVLSYERTEHQKRLLLQQEWQRLEGERIETLKNEMASRESDPLKKQEILDQDLTIPPTIIQDPPKRKGAISFSVWKAEVVDLKRLVEAVAAGHVPLSYIQPNTKLLNEMALALKSELEIPGVKAVCETGLRIRS